MLVLTRKPGEKIIIAGNITITLLEINGGKVRIGIEAPTNVPIMREELEATAFHQHWLESHTDQKPERVSKASRTAAAPLEAAILPAAIEDRLRRTPR